MWHSLYAGVPAQLVALAHSTADTRSTGTNAVEMSTNLAAEGRHLLAICRPDNRTAACRRCNCNGGSCASNNITSSSGCYDPQTCYRLSPPAHNLGQYCYRCPASHPYFNCLQLTCSQCPLAFPYYYNSKRLQHSSKVHAQNIMQFLVRPSLKHWLPPAARVENTPATAITISPNVYMTI